jgi:hypothetical protein
MVGLASADAHAEYRSFGWNSRKSESAAVLQLGLTCVARRFSNSRFFVGFTNRITFAAGVPAVLTCC